MKKKETTISGLQFKSIADELYREYQFVRESEIVAIRIDNPVSLNISESGGHRILDNKGVSIYIPAGWFVLVWEVRPGAEPFAF